MTSKLNKEEQAKFVRDTTLLKEVLIDTLNFSKMNLMLYNNRQVTNSYLLDIFCRFRFNVEALLNNMDSFQKDYRFKLCINELLRAVSADILTVLYLLTFHDNSDPNNESLKNELNLITTEYLRFLEKTIEIDHNLMENLGVESKSLAEKMNWYRNLAPEMMNANGKIKRRNEVRSSTKNEIKEGLKEDGIFLTESEKFDRIKQKGIKGYEMVFIAFKYYSQFHHYNLMSKKLIEFRPAYDTFLMTVIIDCMLEVIAMILQETSSPNLHFANEIGIIRNKLTDSI
jgi:hypothetical protein